MSDRQTEACSTENALHARWAFDVTPGRERHVALQLQELGCTSVERPTKGYVIAQCDPTASAMSHFRLRFPIWCRSVLGPMRR